MQIAQCYIHNLRSNKLKIRQYKGKTWDTQKNTEVEEKWAQKKEERVKEIKENKSLSGTYKSY